jgi:hypothetical protein
MQHDGGESVDGLHLNGGEAILTKYEHICERHRLQQDDVSLVIWFSAQSWVDVDEDGRMRSRKRTSLGEDSTGRATSSEKKQWKKTPSSSDFFISLGAKTATRPFQQRIRLGVLLDY